MFRRTLFPQKPELADELMERSELDSTLRPHQVDFDNYDKICQSFIELSRDHSLPVTPLRVRKPVSITTVSNKEERTDKNENNLEIRSSL